MCCGKMIRMPKKKRNPHNYKKENFQSSPEPKQKMKKAGEDKR